MASKKLKFLENVQKRQLETLPDIPPLGESYLNTVDSLNGVGKFIRRKRFTGNPIPQGSHLRNERLANQYTHTLSRARPITLSPYETAERLELDRDRLALRRHLPTTYVINSENAGGIAREFHIEELREEGVPEQQIKQLHLRNEQMALAAMAPRKFHLKNPWMLVMSKDGELYYYNRISGETRWDLPETMSGGPEALELRSSSHGGKRTRRNRKTKKQRR